MKKLILFTLFLLVSAISFAADKEPIKIEDIMHFRGISSPEISKDGHWLTYTAKPDRGDSAAVLISADGQQRYRWENASKPVVNADGQWAYRVLEPSLLAKEQAAQAKKDGGKADKLDDGLALINLATNQEYSFEKVSSARFSDDGLWFANLHTSDYKPEAKEGKASKAEKPEKTEKSEKPEKKSEDSSRGKKKSDKHKTALLTLHRLSDMSEVTIEQVYNYVFSADNQYLIYSAFDKKSKIGGVFYRNIKLDANQEYVIKSAENMRSLAQQWDDKNNQLAFIMASLNEDEKYSAQAFIWQPKAKKLQQVNGVNKDWYIPEEALLSWSDKGDRLFLGIKPTPATKVEVNTEINNEADLFNIEKLVAERELDIWHSDDPEIKTNERKTWDRRQKQTQLAVYHLGSKKFVALNNEEFDRAVFNKTAKNHKNSLLIWTDTPYQKSSTWGEDYRDHAIVDIKTGKQKVFAKKLPPHSRPSLSPSGRYVVYYLNEAFYRYDSKTGKTTVLAAKETNVWGDEDHDTPSAKPGYGVAGWLADTDTVLLYDKYDIWAYPINGDKPTALTANKGREEKNIFRIIETQKDKDYFDAEQKLLLSVYNDQNKQHGFAELDLASSSHNILTFGPKHYRFISKAEEADTLIYSREDSQEFPDIWASDLKLANSIKLTDENPQINDLLWGEAPELLAWKSLDNVDLQGVLLKPANYDPKKTYPVIFYFYELYSQRMYDFNHMAVNHRPNFAYLNSNGYAVFLPDVRFMDGHPGKSSYNALIPAAQMLIDKGITEKGKIGLQGHSWGGYQAAYLATQTDMFSAIVSGAPVVNMTSAYSGIRIGSGVTRQHQYEKGQSRIGETLWENLDLYIENSPVFFADKVNTPILIQFGDIDDAVPWQQGVDMYMALRRLNKQVLLLQYHGEPHHLKKYPNKVDYTIKMMQFYDHFLRGKAAPDWIKTGEPYDGDK